jgi:hypothetical protein
MVSADETSGRRSLGSGAARPIQEEKNMRSSQVNVVRADVADADHRPAERPQPVPDVARPRLTAISIESKFMTLANTKAAEPTADGEDEAFVSNTTVPETPHRRSPVAVDHVAAEVARPPGAPAYYLGRPARVWLAAFRRGWIAGQKKA